MFRSFSVVCRHFSPRFFEKKTTFFFTNSKAGRARLYLRQSLPDIRLSLTWMILRNFPRIQKKTAGLFYIRRSSRFDLRSEQNAYHSAVPFVDDLFKRLLNLELCVLRHVHQFVGKPFPH